MVHRLAVDRRLVDAQRDDIDRTLDLLMNKQVRDLAFGISTRPVSEGDVGNAAILKILLELPHVASNIDVQRISEQARLPHLRPVE